MCMPINNIIYGARFAFVYYTGYEYIKLMCGAFTALEVQTITHTYTYCTRIEDRSTTAADITSVRTGCCLDHPTTEGEICYSAQMLQLLAARPSSMQLPGAAAMLYLWTARERNYRLSGRKREGGSDLKVINSHHFPRLPNGDIN